MKLLVCLLSYSTSYCRLHPLLLLSLLYSQQRETTVLQSSGASLRNVFCIKRRNYCKRCKTIRFNSTNIRYWKTGVWVLPYKHTGVYNSLVAFSELAIFVKWFISICFFAWLRFFKDGASISLRIYHLLIMQSKVYVILWISPELLPWHRLLYDTPRRGAGKKLAQIIISEGS